MPVSPLSNVRKQRERLEAALLDPNTTPEERVHLSQKLDRLINHAMRVRVGRFVLLNRCILRPSRPRRRF